jgi:Na+/H+-dicarboxylate symporter
MAAIFIAQATNTQLDWTHRLTLLAVEEAEEPEEMVA